MALECQSGLCNGTCSTTLPTVFDAATCPLFNGASAIAVSAGFQHTCAMFNDGTAKCWGLNFGGPLGDGTTTNRSTPVSVIGLGGTVVAVDSGYNHTCAVMSDGAVRCWGQNNFGELGDGTTTNRTTPVSVINLP